MAIIETNDNYKIKFNSKLSEFVNIILEDGSKEIPLLFNYSQELEDTINAYEIADKLLYLFSEFNIPSTSDLDKLENIRLEINKQYEEFQKLYNKYLFDFFAPDMKFIKELDNYENNKSPSGYYKNSIPDYLNLALIEECWKNNELNVKWLCSIGADIHISNDNPFDIVCKTGNVSLAKWIYSKGIDINKRDELAFRTVCGYNHLPMAKWLYSLGVNIHINDDIIFREACEFGNESIAKWLYSVGANINAVDNDAIEWACIKGHESIAKWLYSIGGGNHIDIEIALKKACVSGRLNIAKCMYAIGIDINPIKESLIEIAKENGKYKIIDWLNSI